MNPTLIVHALDDGRRRLPDLCPETTGKPLIDINKCKPLNQIDFGVGHQITRDYVQHISHVFTKNGIDMERMHAEMQNPTMAQTENERSLDLYRREYFDRIETEQLDKYLTNKITEVKRISKIETIEEQEERELTKEEKEEQDNHNKEQLLLMGHCLHQATSALLRLFNGWIRTTRTNALILPDSILKSVCFAFDERRPSRLMLMIDTRLMRMMSKLFGFLSHCYTERDYDGQYLVLCFKGHQGLSGTFKPLSLAFAVYHNKTFEMVRAAKVLEIAESRVEKTERIVVIEQFSEAWDINGGEKPVDYGYEDYLG